jgi:hypothetical protein
MLGSIVSRFLAIPLEIAERYCRHALLILTPSWNSPYREPFGQTGTRSVQFSKLGHQAD